MLTAKYIGVLGSFFFLHFIVMVVFVSYIMSKHWITQQSVPEIYLKAY